MGNRKDDLKYEDDGYNYISHIYRKKYDFSFSEIKDFLYLLFKDYNDCYFIFKNKQKNFFDEDSQFVPYDHISEYDLEVLSQVEKSIKEIQKKMKPINFSELDNIDLSKKSILPFMLSKKEKFISECNSIKKYVSDGNIQVSLLRSRIENRLKRVQSSLSKNSDRFDGYAKYYQFIDIIKNLMSEKDFLNKYFSEQEINQFKNTYESVMNSLDEEFLTLNEILIASYNILLMDKQVEITDTALLRKIDVSVYQLKRTLNSLAKTVINFEHIKQENLNILNDKLTKENDRMEFALNILRKSNKKDLLLKYNDVQLENLLIEFIENLELKNMN